MTRRVYGLREAKEDFLARKMEPLRQESRCLRAEVDNLQEWVDDLQSGAYITCVYYDVARGVDSADDPKG